MTVVMDPIKVTGLREFQAALKSMDGESQKMLRLVLNDAAQIVVDAAKPRVAFRHGAARASMKVQSSQREARVKAGGAKVPYYPWLDFGGQVGPGRTGPRTGTVNRPFIRVGRYIYPAYAARRAAVLRRMETGLADLATGAGLDVS